MDLKLSFGSVEGSAEKQSADVFIIGGGPAAITAGIYLKRKEVDVAIIADSLGGEVSTTTEIDNYPGFPLITGPELAKRFEEHARKLGVPIITDRIEKVEKSNAGFMLKGSREYTSKSVIVATGSHYRELGVPGEKELRGRGVSYCATCDAPFFKDKIVGIVGGGNTAMVDAQELAKIAKKVYIIHRRQEFRADAVEVERVRKLENVEFILDSVVEEIVGEGRVERVKIKNRVTREERWLELDGIFIAIGMIPNSGVVEGLVELNERKEIKVDRECRTSEELVYAAGDVTDVRDKQIIVAAGMGAVAALSAYEDLRSKGLL